MFSDKCIDTTHKSHLTTKTEDVRYLVHQHELMLDFHSLTDHATAVQF